MIRSPNLRSLFLLARSLLSLPRIFAFLLSRRTLSSPSCPLHGLLWVRSAKKKDTGCGRTSFGCSGEGGKKGRREREIEREKSGKTREKGRDNKRVAFSLGLEGGDFLLVVSSGRRCGGHRREEPGCFRPQPRALQVKGRAMKSILSFWCVFMVFLLVCLWFVFAMRFSVFFFPGKFRRLEVVPKLVSGVSVRVFNLGLSTEALGALVFFEVWCK